MKKRSTPNYRPALRDGEYEPPRVLKIVEVPGSEDSRYFSEQCVIDVPGAELPNSGLAETPDPNAEHTTYIPMVMKACSCNAVCSCESVMAPTSTPTLTPTTQLENCVVDELGGWENVLSEAQMDAGNSFSVEKSTSIKEIGVYLDIPVSSSLYLFVYESTFNPDTMIGTLTRLHQTHVANSGTGERWYSSGPIDVSLGAGQSYYIGASWLEAVKFGFGGIAGFQSTSFGQFSIGIWGMFGYPPPETISSEQSSGEISQLPFYMRLSACSTAPEPTKILTPTLTPTNTATPCSCHEVCTCDPVCTCDTVCSCNPQTYYHCTCNPQTYYYCTCNPQTYWY